MKKLILVRHAKSDWPENTEDFDRPLADSGVQDAIKMSEFLNEYGVEMDQLISSPATRALKTCEIFNDVFDVECTTNQQLYNPSENSFLSVIYNLDDCVNTVALFSHNNGISNFANYMTEDLFHFPTCGTAGFEIACEKWSDFDAAHKKMIFFFEPQKLE
ncbi:MAG: histidine phosphatase family protein [Bacteroidetes bacterium]|nr:histidine phosphatase family protein [Bacteroidota bacterium]